MKTYYFGQPHLNSHWSVDAPSVARAVSAFRNCALFPHQYSSGRIGTPAVSTSGLDTEIFLSSKPGSTIPIYEKGCWEAPVAEIPADDPQPLQIADHQIPPVAELSSLSKSRQTLEDRQLALQAALGD